MADILTTTTIGSTSYRLTPEGEALIKRFPNGINMPATIRRPSVPKTPRPPQDRDVAAWLARQRKGIEKADEGQHAHIIGARVGPFAITATDGHRAILEPSDGAPSSREYPKFLLCGVDWIGLTPEFWSAVRRVSVLADRSNAIALAVRPADARQVHILVSAFSDDGEASEPVTVPGSMSLPIWDVPINAKFLMELFGLEDLRLYVRPGADRPVVARLEADTFRVLVQPMKA